MDRTELLSMLELLSEPAFLAENGCVLRGNEAFATLGIADGTPIHHFLYSDCALIASAVPETYPCSIGDRAYTVRLLSVSGCELFLLQSTETSIPAQALANTALSLRRSLQQLYSAAELIDSKIAPDAAEDPAFSSLLQGIFRLERIADNLDYLQKLRSGSYVLKRRPKELRSYLLSMLEKAEALLKESGIRLEWSLPETGMMGSIDEKLLSLAFWNLLSNAAQTRCDAIRVTVERQQLDTLLLQVIDKGNGTRLLERPALMQQYQRMPSPSEAERGVGLGLSLVRTVCELHDGSFLLSEDENGGHTAVMRLSVRLRGNGEFHETVRYPGEQSLDDGLVGLAEVLPRSAFHAEDIFG